MRNDPIRVWEFHNAPEELRVCSTNGGDEDFIVVVPPGMECPWKLAELGCCDNDVFKVTGDGAVHRRVGLEHRSNDEKYLWEKTGNLCPSFIDHTFIISSHA